MGNYSKEEIAILKKKGEWYTVRVMEPYRFWDKKHPWTPEYLKKNKLALMSLSVKGALCVNDESKKRYSQKSPLFLQCGLSIEKGYSGITTQSKIVSLQNIRVDGITELNQIMSDLSNMFGISMWEVRRLQLHNTKLGPVINFNVFNPDGTGSALYLESVEDGDSKRSYFDIPAFEQQRLCNNIQEVIASCKLTMTPKTECAVKAFLEEKAAKKKVSKSKAT